MTEVSWLDDGHEKHHRQRATGEKSKEGQTVFSSIEPVILLENEWVGFEKEVDDTVHKRHVKSDGHQHGFKGEHDEGFEEDGVESILERGACFFD